MGGALYYIINLPEAFVFSNFKIWQAPFLLCICDAVSCTQNWCDLIQLWDVWHVISGQGTSHSSPLCCFNIGPNTFVLTDLVDHMICCLLPWPNVIMQSLFVHANKDCVFLFFLLVVLATHCIGKIKWWLWITNWNDLNCIFCTSVVLYQVIRSKKWKEGTAVL